MTVKASAWWLFRGYRGASAPAAYASRVMLPPPLQSSLPAGWLAFTARELNPLDRDEGFQITSSSSLPGLFPGATSANLHISRHRSKQRYLSGSLAAVGEAAVAIECETEMRS